MINSWNKWRIMGFLGALGMVGIGYLKNIIRVIKLKP
jgi:hypothetical protein